MNSHKIYRFRHSILPIEVEISDQALIYRANIRQKQILLSDIESFFIHQPPDTDQSELLIAHRSHPQASIQRMRIYSDEKQSGFDDLLAELRLRFASKELIDISPQEAYLLMGAKNMSQSVLIGFMGLTIISIALMLLPILLHGLENHQASIQIDQSIKMIDQNQSLPSSFIDLVQAKPLLDYQVILDQPSIPSQLPSAPQSYGKQQTLQKILISFPLVANDWQEGQEIHWIVQASIPIDELDHLSQKRKWGGIVRDLLWEGMGRQDQEAFLKQNLRLSSQVKRLDLNASPQEELKIYGVIIAFFCLLFCAVLIYLKIQKNAVSIQKIPIQKPKPLMTKIEDDVEDDVEDDPKA